MGRFRKSSAVDWELERYYEGHAVLIREQNLGVWVTCVEGFRGGEHKCSGPGARERAIQQALCRIDDMVNVR